MVNCKPSYKKEHARLEISGRDLVELNKNSIESKFADVLSLNKFDIHRPLIAFYKAYSKQLLL
jgi:hypothetical protein